MAWKHSGEIYEYGVLGYALNNSQITNTGAKYTAVSSEGKIGCNKLKDRNQYYHDVVYELQHSVFDTIGWTYGHTDRQ